MNIRKILIMLIGMATVILVGVILMQFVEIEDENVIGNEYTPEAEITDEQMRKTAVKLYFKNDIDGTLISEERVIDAKLLLENPYQTIVQMLILGPEVTGMQKLIPEGTQVYSVVVDAGVAIIDFSAEFLNVTSETEGLNVISSISKSLIGLSEVSGVKILINGEPDKKMNNTEITLDKIF